VDQCPVESLSRKPPLAGWRLVAASAGCFLLPLVLAVVGAVIGRFSPHAQLAGAICGLVLGTVCCVPLARFFAATKEVA